MKTDGRVAGPHARAIDNRQASEEMTLTILLISVGQGAEFH
jgi:hypothetical protein